MKISTGFIERIDDLDTEDVKAVLINIKDGESYDEYFRSDLFLQQSNGTAIFLVDAGLVLENVAEVIIDQDDVEEYTKDESLKKNKRITLMLRQMAELIEKIDGEKREENLWVNFESCKGYENKKFGEYQPFLRHYRQIIHNVVKLHGGLCLFSDYSLSCFIELWRKSDNMKEDLGKNPFVDCERKEGRLKFEFEPSELKHSSIPMFKRLGQIMRSKENSAKIWIKPSKTDTFLYTFSQEGKEFADNTFEREELKQKEKQLSEEEKEKLKLPVASPFEVSVLTMLTGLKDADTTAKMLVDIREIPDAQILYTEQSKGLTGHVILTFACDEPDDSETESESDSECESENRRKNEPSTKGKEEPKRLICGRILTGTGPWSQLGKSISKLVDYRSFEDYSNQKLMPKRVNNQSFGFYSGSFTTKSKRNDPSASVDL